MIRVKLSPLGDYKTLGVICLNFQVLVSDTSPLPSVDVIKSHYLKGELFIIKKSINESPFLILSGIFVSFPSVSDSRVVIMSAK